MKTGEKERYFFSMALFVLAFSFQVLIFLEAILIIPLCRKSFSVSDSAENNSKLC